MVGRKPAVDPNELLKVLSSSREEIAESLGHSSASVWATIARNVENKMTPEAVYTFVKSNRFNCHAVLGIQSKHSSTISFRSIEDETDSEIELLGNCCFESEEFFTIQNSVWQSLVTGNVLKKEWTDTIFDCISAQLKSSCIWMFRNHSFNPFNTGKYYFSCNGYCVECKALLGCWITHSQKSSEAIKVYVSISNVNENDHAHKKRRPLTGIKRSELGQRLSDGKSAVSWLREQARENTNGRLLYPLEVLRKCRQEHKQRKQFSETAKELDPINSLLEMKYTERFSTILHKIGLDPFFAMYWSPLQTVIYNDYIKTGKRKLFIDATGTLCNKLHRPESNRSSNIFLYVAVINVGILHGQIPVTQMLSECHNMNQITYWLSEWMGMISVKPPHTTVTDHSLALLGAISKAIAGESSLSSYLEKCFQILQSGQHACNLKVFIRVDYPHLLKLVSSWKCFNTNKVVKRFYMKLIAKLVRITSLSEAECLIENILITANSTYEGHNINGIPFESEKSKVYLKQVISGLSIVDLESEFEQSSTIEESVGDQGEDEDFENGSSRNENYSVNFWIAKMIKAATSKYVIDVEEGVITARENFHYLPDFSKSFCRLLRTYPLWSAVMIKFFETSELTASSAPVESYFNDLKNRSFRDDTLPIRADKFICKHIKEIEGMTKLLESQTIFDSKTVNFQDDGNISIENKDLQTYDNKDGGQIAGNNDKKTKRIRKKVVRFDDNISNTIDESMNENPVKIVENWKGLGLPVPKKKLRTSYYASPNPEILILEERKKIEIAVIKNGNLVNKTRSTKLADENYILRNTCAFDAILQGLCTAYCDSVEFQKYVNDHSEDILVYDCIKEITSKGFTKEFVKLRVQLLKNIFVSDQLKNGVQCIPCEINICAGFEKVCKGIESMIESYNCAGCGFAFVNKKKSLFLNRLETLNLLEQTIKQSFKESIKCRGCSKSVNMCSNPNSLLFVECEQLNLNIALRQVPLVLRLDDKNFFLRYAIGYKGSNVNYNSLGHYFCLCKRIDGAWEIYDDLSKKVVIDKESNYNVHALVFTV